MKACTLLVLFLAPVMGSGPFPSPLWDTGAGSWGLTASRLPHSHRALFRVVALEEGMALVARVEIWMFFWRGPQGGHTVAGQLSAGVVPTRDSPEECLSSGRKEGSAFLG